MFTTIRSAIRKLRHTGWMNARRQSKTTRLMLEALEDRVVLYGPPSAPVFFATPWSASQVNLSSGWVMDNATGQWVYGLFNANGGFLSQNFTTNSIGGGSGNAITDLRTGSEELAGLSLMPATDHSVASRLVLTDDEVLVMTPQAADEFTGVVPGSAAASDAV
jgi:hypothetical protein